MNSRVTSPAGILSHAENERGSSTQPILRLGEICKSFGGVRALNGVSFSIVPGEIHAIVGENGAGKSTLMNILAGIYVPDSGQIYLDGKPFLARNPSEARTNGISIVFQELALFPTLSVDANLYAGKELRRGIQLDHQAMLANTAEAIVQMEIDLRPADTVEDLSIAQRQWVEIARALSDDARILILDEPNSALNHHETDVLFKLLAHLKARGITILYISHRLEEVFRVADRITVLRDGRYVGTWDIAATSISRVVSEMVASDSGDRFVRTPRPHGKVVLRTEDLSIRNRLESLTFSVRQGEVVGIAGLAGSGINDLLGVLFGLKSPSSGRLLLDEEPFTATTPRQAMQRGVAMVPSDRRGLGLLMNWSVVNNLTLGILRQLSRRGLINHRVSRQLSQGYVERLSIITDRLDKEVAFLSGGNQQKVLLARWLARKPRLLILDDPTRGIDVGAKNEIYQLIDAIASEGVAVILTSSEIEEILALSDRVLVLRGRKCIAELPHNLTDKSLLMEFVAGDATLAMASLRARQGAGDGKAIIDEHREVHPHKPGSLTNVTAEPVMRKPDATSLLRGLLAQREFGVLLALMAVFILFAFLTPYFLTSSNLLLISRQMAIIGVITVGMTFVLASGEVDLSVGWNFNLVMTAMAVLMVSPGIDPWLAIPFGLLIGGLLGAINGILATSLQLPTIIVTLGTMTVFRGLALALNGGRTVANLPESTFFDLGSGSLAGLPYLTIVMLVVFASGAWILRNTRFARHVLAMGANRQAAERVGIPTQRLRVLVMAFSGVLCGIAGVLGLAFLGAADAQSGGGYELTAIAAAIIGGAKLGGGAGTVWGSLVGIALITAIQNGLALVGLPPAWQIASNGAVIIAAVTVDYLTRARRKGPAQVTGRRRKETDTYR